MTRISKGTVSVENGGTTVTAWLGDDGLVLSEITAPKGSHVIIEGVSNFIKERLSTTEFELELAHAGAGGDGLSAMVSAMTAAERNTGTLNARTAQVIQELSVLDANGRGLFYNLIGVTGANDPGPGNLAFNDATPSAVTEIYLDVLDANSENRDVGALIDLWEPGTLLLVRSLETTAYVALRTTSAPVDAVGYRKVAVDYVGDAGTLGNEPVAVEFLITGQSIQIDAAGPFAGRSAYDTENKPFTYASVDGADGLGPPTVLYIMQSDTDGDWSVAIPFQGPESEPRVAVTVWDPGRPGAGEEVWRGIFAVPVNFPADFNGVNAVSHAEADSAPTADAIYSLQKNGATFGTLTFAAGVTTGAFSSPATDFAAGDVLSLLAPDPRDATLARIAITLAGTR